MACDCTAEISDMAASIEANVDLQFANIMTYLTDTFGADGSWGTALGQRIISTNVATLALRDAVISADPNLADLIRTMTDGSGGTMNNAINTSLNLLYDIIGSYLSTTPEFDHPNSILKAMYKGIFKTFVTDD